MAKAFYSNNVLMTIILFLAVVLLFNILYGCRMSPKVEGFEDIVMSSEEPKEEEQKEKTLEALKVDISPILDEQALKELMSKVKDSAITMLPPKDIDVSTEKKVEEKLNKKEAELFEAIRSNQMSNEDLEKLVKAGVVTENMIERFLAKMDTESSDEKIEEPVVEGFSCGRDYATF